MDLGDLMPGPSSSFPISCVLFPHLAQEEEKGTLLLIYQIRRHHISPFCELKIVYAKKCYISKLFNHLVQH